MQTFLVVLLVHFYLMEGGDHTSKKLEAYCGDNSDIYLSDIEELSKYDFYQLFSPCLYLLGL